MIKTQWLEVEVLYPQDFFPTEILVTQINYGHVTLYCNSMLSILYDNDFFNPDSVTSLNNSFQLVFLFPRFIQHFLVMLFPFTLTKCIVFAPSSIPHHNSCCKGFVSYFTSFYIKHIRTTAFSAIQKNH